MESWAEKYRPESLSDLIGNSKTINDLKNWASSWGERTTKKGVILSGPPGCGKTSAAIGLANDMGWEIVELNASDTRSGDVIEGIALRAGLFQTFGSKGISSRNLILLDEADNLYERARQSKNKTKNYSDRGGKRAIAKTLEQTKQPVVITVNDLYNLTKGTGSKIKRLAMTLKFQRPSAVSVAMVLNNVCESEKLEISQETVRTMAEVAKGDLRAAINDLQSLSEGNKEIIKEDVEKLGARDREIEMFDTLNVIFNSDNYNDPRTAIFDLNEQPREVATWVSDNIPIVYKHPSDIERAYEKVAYADLLLARVIKNQNYGLWGYASELMSSGVALSKAHPTSGRRPQFPSWIRKMGASRFQRGYRDSLAKKIGGATHLSVKESKMEQLAVLSTICQNNHEKATRIAGKLELNENELAILMGIDKKDKKINEIMEKSNEYRQEREVITLDYQITHDKDEDDEPSKIVPKADNKQKSLFEF
ncbi:MAG: replication factor C large subunit [Candidatus Thermoplasmatota archaeon]|nr:replication factor C large subunit [Candidatus Thermoplasmatota archaeon]